MKILITGAAGFVGSHTAKRLLEAGHSIIGVDNINDYYTTKLKRDRLEQLSKYPEFYFRELDINNISELNADDKASEIDVVLHLAAQAGVRYSIENPFAYAHSNLNGHLNMLEFVRHHKSKPFMVYASSSSVYGNNSIAPFREDSKVDKPESLYAATKISNEMMSSCYAKLYNMPLVGLRFFTVYGPWGRPDMAYWTFSEKIIDDKPIPVFNNGKLRRDFTYIDDIVEGIIRIITQGPKNQDVQTPHKVYNIGNSTPVELLTFIETLESALGKKAIIEMKPMQAGDVYETSADVSSLNTDYGFSPNTTLEYGLGKFAEWFKNWKNQ